MLYTYELKLDRDTESWDRALAVACLQGLINREAPSLYVFAPPGSYNRPASDWCEGWARADSTAYWWELFRGPGGWLADRTVQEIPDLEGLLKLAGDRVKGVIIWDPEVPATVNVATTIAGVRDGVVLSPELAEELLPRWKLPVIEDLRGRFTGLQTGSKKNDAYRWAMREYLYKGKCSSRFLAWYPDAFVTREKGAWDYIVCRDWAVQNRLFCFSLWPWADEPAADEPDQPSGTDYETFTRILTEVKRQAGGKHMTELAGFFAFYDGPMWTGALKTLHPDGVYTEWETVWQISAYDTYQNTACDLVYNQSLHSQAPFKPLKQSRPVGEPPLENKTYICLLMADYDSTKPLYAFLRQCWDDPARGKLPLAWGIDPNLVDMLPDLLTYFYETATPNDFFVSDASAAGYFNPNRIQEASWPLFIRHNKYYFDLLDMSIAGMVLDFDQPKPATKDAFSQFAPDGYACITWDQHGTGGKAPSPQVWKGMPIIEMTGGASSLEAPEQAAEALLRSMPQRQQDKPYFQYFRIVYTPPSLVAETIDRLRALRPELDLEVVDPYTFFRLYKRHLQGGASS